METNSDAEAVIASMLKNLESHNKGDWADIADTRLPDATVFGAGGGLMRHHSRRELQDAFAAGFGSDLRAEHVDAKVYGNTAIITAYYVGRWFLEDGTAIDGSWRFSEVRVKEQEKWRIAHTHISQVSSPQTEYKRSERR